MRNNKKLVRIAAILGVMILVLSLVAMSLALADTGNPSDGEQLAQSAQNDNGLKAIGVGIAIGFAACGGGIGMGIAGGKASESISRQPEVEGKIRTNFMLALVFIETAIIYALLAVILIIFVM